MKHTRQDLNIMQGWSLEEKIKVSQMKILEWYREYNGQVFTSFSGGKDSTVLLDLARQVCPDIPAVYVDTGLEYPELRDFVKTKDNVIWLRPRYPFTQIIEKYGYPVISKEVSDVINGARKGQPYRLARLNGENPNSWEVVARYLTLKAEPEFYENEVVRCGRFTGSRQTLAYVNDVIGRYDRYCRIAGR